MSLTRSLRLVVRSPHEAKRNAGPRIALPLHPGYGPQVDQCLQNCHTVPPPFERCSMSNVTRTVKDLVIANRILAHEGIVDAFGDVSVRHPSDKTRFFLARAVSPGVVEVADIVEFGLDGTSLDGTSRSSNVDDLPGAR